MFLYNNIVDYPIVSCSLVQANGIVELPDYCRIQYFHEQIVLVANNEYSAWVVPKDDIDNRIIELRGRIEASESIEEQESLEKQLEEIESLIILQADVFVNKPGSESELDKLGFKLDYVTEFLDDRNGKPCVIFQNINGRMLMYYGAESLKKNMAANTQKGK